jgi:hypothetical protein
MALDVKGVRVTGRTDTSMDLEILLESSEVVKLQLNSITGAAIIKAIVENCPYPSPARAGVPELLLDFPSYGFATSPSAEGHVALAFQLSQNRYPVAIRVPHQKLSEIRASIAQWETQQPGKA